MRCAFLFLLLAVSLSAEPTRKLNSDLLALSNSDASSAVVSGRILDDILTLADKSTSPSRRTTLDFVNELSKALRGKPLRPQNIASLSTAILDVLQSSDVPSSQFHAALDHFRDGLIALGASPAQARMVTGTLLIVGQEIRGPEDLGVQIR